MNEPALSAVCLLGSRRERLPRLIRSMADQTSTGELEVVLVDGGPPGRRPQVPEPPGWKLVPWPRGGSFGEARAAGAREATGEVVAYLLDHAYPEPGWAEALIAAYRDRAWAAVGYAFRNANPGRYASRATFLAHFGPWESTESQATSLLPGNLVSYRRHELLALGPELDDLLDVDASVHRRLLGSGLGLAVEPGAVTAVECYRSVLDACRANAIYGRMLAARRARSEGWSAGRRLLNALPAPLVATAIRMARIWRGAQGRRRGEMLACLPAVMAICLSWALGESSGYLLGEGGAPERLAYWELEAVRAQP